MRESRKIVELLKTIKFEKELVEKTNVEFENLKLAISGGFK
jgi:hypothetical protein